MCGEVKNVLNWKFSHFSSPCRIFLVFLIVIAATADDFLDIMNIVRSANSNKGELMKLDVSFSKGVSRFHFIRCFQCIKNKLNLLFSKGGELIVKFIKVIDYKAHRHAENEEPKFWAKIASGGLGTNKVTVQINSYLDVDCDVEFYGYKRS